MKIKELVLKNSQILKDNRRDDYNIIAKEILLFVLKKDKQYLLVNRELELDAKIIEENNKYIEEIIKGKPLQYITNKQEFMGYDFYVDESVLIPQPDTEVVVQQTISIYTEKKYHKEDNIKILDLCTGSGAIAISLCKEIKRLNNNIKIDASDISTHALKVAERNNRNLNENVQFILSDMFQNIHEKYDIIVSNPPYIKSKIINVLDQDVKNEPLIALDGGIDGLEFYRNIINNGYKYLKEDGYICLEIGYDEKNDILQLLKISDKYTNINCYKDLSNNDRCITFKIK